MFLNELLNCQGIASAYVFVDLLPTIFEYQNELVHNEYALFLRDRFLFLCVFAGFVLFYTLEAIVRHSRRGMQEKIQLHKEQQEESQKPKRSLCSWRGLRERLFGGEETLIQYDSAPKTLFWIHIIPFIFKNFLIGFVFVRRAIQGGLLEAYLYCVAVTLHMLVVDLSLYTHYRTLYESFGRFAIVSSLGAGYVISLFITVGDLLGIYILEAILAGSIILNVIKEELPDERESNVWAFLLGAIAFSILLVFI